MLAQFQDVAAAFSVLRDHQLAIPARDWPGQGGATPRPGLYSWWVTEAGASDLTNGLGVGIVAGLIYAGQAGATRWPSGRRYDQTLQGPISENHFASAIGNSTLRRTLAVCLAKLLGLEFLDRPKPTLAPGGAKRLTTWMRDHLSVVVFPFDDRDSLENLEHRVLQELDPPLNLRGMNDTVTRAALTQARSRLAGQRDLADHRRAIPTAPHEVVKRADRQDGVTLHEEIAEILLRNGNEWMTTKDIAQEVNKRAMYQKRDGTDVTPFQIHGRTRNYDSLFERDGSRVRLIA